MRWKDGGMLLWFVACVLFVLPCARAAEAYKCKHADGSVGYQQSPCEEGAQALGQSSYQREMDAPHQQYVPSRAWRQEQVLTAPRPGAGGRAAPLPGSSGHRDYGVGAPPARVESVQRCVNAYGRVYSVPAGTPCGTSVTHAPAPPRSGVVYDYSGRPIPHAFWSGNQAIDGQTGRVLADSELHPSLNSPPQSPPVRTQDRGSEVATEQYCAELRRRYTHLPVNTTKQVRDRLDEEIDSNCRKRSLWQ